MNTTLRIAASAMVVALLSACNTTVAADDEHAPHHPAAESGAGSAMAGTTGNMMANMQKMQTQMAAIRAARDPQERARLMAEHMNTMQQSNGCVMMGNGLPMQGGQGGGMNMMQMMMEQMQQHQQMMGGMGK